MNFKPGDILVGKETGVRVQFKHYRDETQSEFVGKVVESSRSHWIVGSSPTFYSDKFSPLFVVSEADRLVDVGEEI